MPIPSFAFPRTLLTSAFAIAVAGLLSAPWPAAHAQTSPVAAGEVRSYDVAPGALGEVLNRFARQSGLALSFPPSRCRARPRPACAATTRRRSA